MNFPVEQSALYGLSKDMLVKLILTIQNQYKPENIKDEKIIEITRKYMLETFKRKTIIIKEYLKRFDELADVLSCVKTFKVFPTDTFIVLSISFHDGSFARCTYISGDFGLTCFGKNCSPVYQYREFQATGPLPVEEILQENEMKESQKYIDFIKFLNHKQLIKRLFNYLNLYTKRKDFEEEA